MLSRLLLVSLASLFPLALGSYIRNLMADFAILFDDRKFNALADLFTPNANYSVGNLNMVGPSQIATFVGNLTKDPTQLALSTQSINLLPPFDALGGAVKAMAVTYVIATVFGSGKFKPTGNTSTFSLP